jgi:hypothetical protein
MDYIISEDRLVKLVDKYIATVVGELIVTKSSHQFANKEDFDIVDKDGNMIFQYFARHLGVSQHLFSSISDLFSINQSVTENLFQRWFEQKYPDLPLKDVYPSIYF